MLTSVRASCSVPQKPFFMNVTILVEYKATQMSRSRGTQASRVKRPTKRSAPQMISVTPMKGAMSCGKGMPIFVKRPTPSVSGNRNFWMPSERKTHPTRMRISRTAFAARLVQITSVFEVMELPPLTRLRTHPTSSHIVEQGHEAKVHVQLLVPVQMDRMDVVTGVAHP